MDIISFSEAATANGRIEKINANPDSSSGIVTVPKTIAAGETVTIPAGRVAILPNVTVDGTLNIENGGEVFIPSGATFGDLDNQIALKADTTYVDAQVATRSRLVQGTAVNSTSGTSIDFTGIPSWAKKITMMFNGVSTNGTSAVQIQLGDSEGIENSGYSSASTYLKGGALITGAVYTTGFGIYQLNALASRYGSIILTKLTANTWEAQGLVFEASDSSNSTACGGKTLSSTLDRIRITTVNGTDTFDAGLINILYEG